MTPYQTMMNWFRPSAPDQGVPDSGIAPEALNPSPDDPYQNDSLGAARFPQFTVEKVHLQEGQYLPSWKFVPPPGFGDAPQHVWSTYQLFPVSIDGPGDRPASYLRWITPQTVANFAMRWQGMPVDGGAVLLTGLYTPAPMEGMTSDIFGN